jgi:hypothetical protein
VSSSNEEIWPLRTGQQRQSLKHAQQFEHDDDNDNDSNYVEDVSVHIASPIRVSSRWRDFSDEWDRLYWSFKAVFDPANKRFPSDSQQW